MIIVMVMIMIVIKWGYQPWNYNDTNNEMIMIGISAKCKEHVDTTCRHVDKCEIGVVL